MISNIDGLNEVRNDTKKNWEKYNPVLEKGELAVEVDGNKMKLKCGDGVSSFVSLPYIEGKVSTEDLEDIQNSLIEIGNEIDTLGKTYTFIKTMAINANTWIETGITGKDLPTGCYILYFYNKTFGLNNQLSGERWSGVISWYSDETNSNNATEINLHNSGAGDNSIVIKARTIRSINTESNPYLRLQLNSNQQLDADDWNFYFRKIF